MEGSRIEIHQKIFYFLCISIAFSIPVYGRLLPPLIALLVLNWLVQGRFLHTFPLIFKEKHRFLIFSFSLFYLIYVIGMFWSADLGYGFFDLEVKLSLLIFPLIFATSEEPVFEDRQFRNILLSFVLGSFSGTLILFGNAFYNTWVKNLPDAFYYSNLSWFFHPSYLALFYTFAISIIAFLLIERKNQLDKVIKTIFILLIVYFFIFIFLLSSKSGLLSLLLLSTFYGLVLIFIKRNPVQGVKVIIITLLAFYIGWNLFPFASGRIESAGKDLTTYDSSGRSSKSTGERIDIWKASLKIIKKHYMNGVGTGDVKNELLKEYRIENILPAFTQKLNAHNQYLQTFIAVGGTGFLILIVMIVFPAFTAFRNDDFLYMSLILIFGLNMLTESMLETQAGVIFYAFFNTLLFAQKQ